MTTTSEGWASDLSRAPWTARFDAAEREWAITGADGHHVAFFPSRRDAEFVCACVNGQLGNPRAMVVRWVSEHVWLGQCNYCQPTWLVLGDASMSTLERLQRHFRERHTPPSAKITPTPVQPAADQEIDLR